MQAPTSSGESIKIGLGLAPDDSTGTSRHLQMLSKHPGPAIAADDMGDAPFPENPGLARWPLVQGKLDQLPLGDNQL